MQSSRKGSIFVGFVRWAACSRQSAGDATSTWSEILKKDPAGSIWVQAWRFTCFVL